MALLSFKWLFPLFFSLLHPFYVSVTEITHHEKSRSIEVSSKINAEDLQDILKIRYKTTFDFDAAISDAQQKLLLDYLNKNFYISIDGRPVQLNFLGFEKESEAVYCYFELEGVNTPRKIEVRNTLLLDFTSEQVNIVHVVVKGERKSSKFDTRNTQYSFQY